MKFLNISQVAVNIIYLGIVISAFIAGMMGESLLFGPLWVILFGVPTLGILSLISFFVGVFSKKEIDSKKILMLIIQFVILIVAFWAVARLLGDMSIDMI